MSSKSLVLAALAVAGLSLQAQEGLRFGGQVGAVFPLTDVLKDASNTSGGWNIGGMVTYEWKKGQMWRGRVDYTNLPYHEITYPTYTVKHALSALTISAEYLFFVSGKAEGFYLGGGLNVARWRAESDFSRGITGTEAKIKTSAGVNAAMGWQFTPMFGIEVRGIFANKIDTYTVEDNAANTVIAEVHFRF